MILLLYLLGWMLTTALMVAVMISDGSEENPARLMGQVGVVMLFWPIVVPVWFLVTLFIHFMES